MAEQAGALNLVRKLGDPAAVAAYLATPGNRAELLTQAVRTRAVVIGGLETFQEDAEHRNDLEQILAAGQSALEKIAEQGEQAGLTPAERVAVEAVFHLVARPAILVQSGIFQTPPERWAKPLQQERNAITANLPRIGALERTTAAGTELVGTAFLCGPGVAMTNRHVLETFALNSSASWKFASGYGAALDFAREKGVITRIGFRIEEPIGDHPDAELDLGLLRIAAKSDSGQALPEALTISKVKPDPVMKRSVYIVGYPKVDPQHTLPEVLARIFAGIYGVKRLQPGLLLAADDEARDVQHDCSTLGGNSGSPLLDLATNQVIGLHYFGIYNKVNNAVALWTLADDVFLKKAKVQFG